MKIKNLLITKKTVSTLSGYASGKVPVVFPSKIIHNDLHKETELYDGKVEHNEPTFQEYLDEAIGNLKKRR